MSRATPPGTAGRRAPRALLTVSGTLDADVGAQVAAGTRPRPDYAVLAERLDADVVDHDAARAASGRVGRWIERLAGAHAVVAWWCFRERRRYDVILTDGEQVGLPLALLWRLTGRRHATHVMIVHIMSVPMKQRLFRWFRLGRCIDAMIVYSSWQQRFCVEQLGMPDDRVVRSPFMVDTDFFSPARADPPTRDGPVVATAGLERRDYATLIEAARDLDARVVIAAASHFSTRHDSTEGVARPDNVEVCSLTYVPLRQLYADADVVVMPLEDVEFQAGVTTILEAMAMDKAVVCSRTRGQVDIVDDEVNGVYVPPGDADALRSAIERLLAHPARARELGTAGRDFVERQADVDVYADAVASVCTHAYEVRNATAARAT